LNKTSEYFNKFISWAIKSEDHLETFINSLKNENNPWTEADYDTFRTMWQKANSSKLDEDTLKKVTTDMTKDELEAHAIKTYGVDIDKRKNKSTLVKEVENLKNKLLKDKD
jgi:hypothetical protein